MARAKSSEQAKNRAKTTALDDINRGIDTLKNLIAQVEDLSREGHPYREAVLARTDLSIRESIRRIFGEKSIEYQAHKVHKVRTNSRVESAQTTTVLKQLVAQLENQKRDFLGLNPLPRHSDPSIPPSGEKPVLKPVPAPQQAAHTGMSGAGPTSLPLRATPNTNNAAPAVTTPAPFSPARNDGQHSPLVPTPAATSTQTADAPVLDQSANTDGGFPGTQPPPHAPPISAEPMSSQSSVTELGSPKSSSKDQLKVDLIPASSRPSHVTLQSDHVAHTPHSPPHPTPDVVQPIEPSSPPEARTPPVETLTTQTPTSTLETEEAPHLSPQQHEPLPSLISPATVASPQETGSPPAPAPVQVVENPVLSCIVPGAERSSDTQPVLSSPPLSAAPDEPSIAFGSSGSDALRRSNDQSDVQSMEPRREDPLQLVRRICSRFHLITRQLRVRKDDRPSLDVEDEYDVQDLMHALLRLEFDEVRPIESWPSYANGKSQTSYALRREKAVIVVKKTKPGITVRDLSEQVKNDTSTYASWTDCQTLFCFIYDPEGRIGNPRSLEAELTVVSDGYTVEVIIAPK